MSGELAQEIASSVRPGTRLWWAPGVGEPWPILDEVFALCGHIPVDAFCGMSLRRETIETIPLTWRISSYGALGTLRSLAQHNRIDIVPCNYSALPRLFAHGHLPTDVGIVQVTPPDAAGLCGLGVGPDYASDALRHTEILFAEVNHALVDTDGPRVPLTRFAAVMHTDRPLIESPDSVPDEVEMAIARNVASLVRDGDTIQIGVGRVPSAVLTALSEHNDLGVHSGIVSTGIGRLVARGVITGACKAIDTGRTVAGTAVGDASFYDYAARNRHFSFRGTSYTHDPAVLSRLNNLVSINTSIQADLTGQINAEIKNGTYIGGVGGQADFARAASTSGHASIVAQRSTSAGKSAIVAHMTAGAVSTPKTDVAYFVTEHGTADLRGCSVAERSRRLIDVAAPEHRSELIEAARAMFGTARAPVGGTPT